MPVIGAATGGIEYVSNVNPAVSTFRRLCGQTSKEGFDRDLERIRYCFKEIRIKNLYSDPPHVEGFSEEVMDPKYVPSYAVSAIEEITSINMDDFVHEITCCSEFDSKNVLLKTTKTIKYNQEVVNDSNSNVRDRFNNIINSNSNVTDSSEVFFEDN